VKSAEFDHHAATYRQAHQQNIALTGEDPEYFSEYKMRDFKSLIQNTGLPLNGHYLDFGSGIGNSVRFFQECMPDAELTCADVSQESLNLSRERHGDTVKYQALSGDRLPFDNGQFDGAFACCVFHHIPPHEHHGILQELRRVIKKGGLLMIYEHNPYNPLTVRSVRNCPFDENAILIKANDMKQCFMKAGFQLQTTDFRVFFPAQLSSLRPLEDKIRWLPLGAQYFVAGRP
jgi:ubiquinone/menaquinone biosynthesis C-methylase UbiE